MARSWQRISPPVINDGIVQWTPSTPGTHYTLVDEGMESYDDSDFIFVSIGEKKDVFRVDRLNGASKVITRLRVGFRYKGEAVPEAPGLELTWFIGGVRWGSIAKVNVNSDGEWVNGQATFNLGSGYTTDDWDAAGTRAIRFLAAPAGPGYTYPEGYGFESE